MRKILLVEDDTMIASGIKYALEMEGYETYHVRSKEDALNAIREMEFQLAILDMQLPDGIGFDVSDKLNKTHTSIIFLTVVDDEDTTEDYVYALIKEDNGWSVSPDGITECIEFDVPMSKEKELNLNLAKEAVQFDGALIRVNLYNDTSNSYVFGTTDEKTEIIVETTEGTFTSIVEEPQKIEKKARNYFIAKIENLKGDITKVTVTSLFDLDKDGNAILDTKKDITAYSK